MILELGPDSASFQRTIYVGIQQFGWFRPSVVTCITPVPRIGNLAHAHAHAHARAATNGNASCALGFSLVKPSFQIPSRRVTNLTMGFWKYTVEQHRVVFEF